MITFQQLYTEVQTQVSDTDTSGSSPQSSLTFIKRAINQGMKHFGAILNREWRLSYKTFNIVANQQYYQMPEDAIRMSSLTVLSATGSTITYPLTEIADEDRWNQLNFNVESSSFPMYYFVRGSDEFGIWPIPSAAITSGGTLGYERRMRDMTQDDYVTGTVTMTNASATVTGSGTTWTTDMIGRVFFVTDGSADGQGYKVAGVGSSTSLTLENTYGGTSGAGRTYSIGEVPDIPDEFHESLIDYACYRYYRRVRDFNAAKEMRATFDEALNECKADYSSKTASTYISPRTTPQPYLTNVDRTITGS